MVLIFIFYPHKLRGRYNMKVELFEYKELYLHWQAPMPSGICVGMHVYLF